MSNYEMSYIQKKVFMNTAFTYRLCIPVTIHLVDSPHPLMVMSALSPGLHIATYLSQYISTLAM